MLLTCTPVVQRGLFGITRGQVEPIYWVKSLFCLLFSHNYSINLWLDIREYELCFPPPNPNILRSLGLSKPPFFLGTPWKGGPGLCELYSFAQRKVFVLKSKRLWVLLLWAPSYGPILGICSVRNSLRYCLDHSHFCSINSLYSIPSRKPTLTSPALCLNKSEIDPSPPHSSRVSSSSSFRPSNLTPALRITAATSAYYDCLVTCLSSSKLWVFEDRACMSLYHKAVPSAWLMLNQYLMVNTKSE